MNLRRFLPYLALLPVAGLVLLVLDKCRSEPERARARAEIQPVPRPQPRKPLTGLPEGPGSPSLIVEGDTGYVQFPKFGWVKGQVLRNFPLRQPMAPSLVPEIVVVDERGAFLYLRLRVSEPKTVRDPKEVGSEYMRKEMEKIQHLGYYGIRGPARTIPDGPFDTTIRPADSLFLTGPQAMTEVQIALGKLLSPSKAAGLVQSETEVWAVRMFNMRTQRHEEGLLCGILNRSMASREHTHRNYFFLTHADGPEGVEDPYQVNYAWQGMEKWLGEPHYQLNVWEGAKIGPRNRANELMQAMEGETDEQVLAQLQRELETATAELAEAERRYELAKRKTEAEVKEIERVPFLVTLCTDKEKAKGQRESFEIGMERGGARFVYVE